MWLERGLGRTGCFERDGVIVTAKDTSGAVGYALFEQMSHLQYVEPREDCRRRGAASRLWAKVRELAVAHGRDCFGGH